LVLLLGSSNPPILFQVLVLSIARHVKLHENSDPLLPTLLSCSIHRTMCAFRFRSLTISVRSIHCDREGSRENAKNQQHHLEDGSHLGRNAGYSGGIVKGGKPSEDENSVGGLAPLSSGGISNALA